MYVYIRGVIERKKRIKHKRIDFATLNQYWALRVKPNNGINIH